MNLSLLPRLLLAAAAGLFLMACGSASATSDELAVGNAMPTATPIPTTPPILLPPADDTLPALAPVVTTEEQHVFVAADEPVAPTTTALAPTATAVLAPTATAVVVAEPAPTLVSADSWSECVRGAAEATNAIVLLDPIAASTTTDLTSQQLNALAAASANCDVVATNLAATDLGDHVATSQSCLNAWLASSGGGSVFVGLVSIGWGQPTPSWAQPHLVDALSACFTGASFAADVMSVVSIDASLQGAFESTCLAASFDASGTMAGFAQQLATNPAAATLYIELSDAWVLNCANAGQMVAAAAAAEGVVLSQATIACIDADLKSSGAIAQLVAGTADTQSIGVATIACLTNDEAAALLG